MNKIKRFFDCQVPVNLCNFECDYCTVGQWRKFEAKERPTSYTLFKYPVNTMLAALKPERLGGTCAFNLCGNGETFLHPQILKFAEGLLKMGHYVSIVSNGTVNSAIDYLCNMDEELRTRVFIKFSFHYIELVKKNMLDRYFDNVNKAHRAGISLTVELVASDNNVKYIDEIKKVCMDRLGTLCHLTDPRLNTSTEIRHLTEMPMEEHLKVWAEFESALFDYRQATWGQNRKDRFCYGGVWSFNLALSSGHLKQCYRNSDSVQFIFDNIDEPIHFVPRGNHCSFAHCFNSHVFDCLCGVVPEIQSPMYIQLRDRELPDGTHWIKNEYLDVYSHRVCENNDEYSEKQKIVSNGIIDVCNDIVPTKEFALVMQGMFECGNYGVYGQDRLAVWLKENCRVTEDLNKADTIVVGDYVHYAQIKSEVCGQYRADVMCVASFIDIVGE